MTTEQVQTSQSPSLPKAPGIPGSKGESVEIAQAEEGINVPPKKLVPVIFFDEAHRLPLLIRDRKAMKCILDAMLVLTKQVRPI